MAKINFKHMKFTVFIEGKETRFPKFDTYDYKTNNNNVILMMNLKELFSQGVGIAFSIRNHENTILDDFGLCFDTQTG